MFVFAILFIMLFSCSSPVMIALLIVAMALNLGLMASLLASKWLFITIFMVFLGGMMVLFFYMLSLSTPVKLQTSFKKRFIWPILILPLAGSLDVLAVKGDNILSHLFNSLGFQTLIYLALVLFLALIVVVKISENFKGSLLSMW